MKKILEEIKSQLISYMYIIKLLRKINNPLIIFQIIYGIMSTLYFTVNIYFPKLIVDEITTTHNYEKVIFIIFIMVTSTMVVKTFTMLFEVYQSNNFCKSRDLLKVEIAKKKMTTDFKNTEDPNHLDIQEKAMYAATQFPQLSFNIFSKLIGSVLKIILSLYFLASLNLIMFLIILLNVLVSHKINKKASRILYNWDMKKSKDRRGQAYLFDLISDFKTGKTIRVYNIQNHILQKFGVFNKNIYDIEKEKENFSRKTSNKLQMFDVLQIAVVYTYLAYQYAKGAVTIGDFIIVLNATTQFMIALKDLTSVFVDFDKSALFVNDYNRFILYEDVAKASDNDERIAIPNKINTIEFKNVNFAYPNQKRFAVFNLNLKINSNNKVMLVGENGSGKTTFVKLLLRLYDVSEGEILINGINIKKFDYWEYMKLFSAVFQDYKIFAYTVKENICFDNEPENINDILKILDKMVVLNKIETLENGIDTHADKAFVTDGTTFSGGEMQKLVLCRSLYKNGQIHVLDEPTSSLDPISEYKIYKNYNNEMINKTVIYISHRMSISHLCNQIIVFDNGKVKEQGSHSNLLERDGIYAEMYKKQASLYTD